MRHGVPAVSQFFWSDSCSLRPPILPFLTAVLPPKPPHTLVSAAGRCTRSVSWHWLVVQALGPARAAAAADHAS
jgi:hypothetical protein